jgi:beta-barrel assembly-enhancing protease
MSSRSLKCLVAGLGALALSCAGVRVPHIPGPAGELVQTVSKGAEKGSKIAGTARQLNNGRADCQKLAVSPSVEEEYALGGAVALNWVQRGGGLLSLDSHEELVRYINVVGRNLGAQSPRPTLRWTFGVLRTAESFNAISAPGGYVFVTLGLLRGMENEAQLAGVLAHEIAHITGKHVLARYSRVKVAQCERAVTARSGMALANQLGIDLTPGAIDDLFDILNNWKGTLDLDRHVELLGGLAEASVDDLLQNGLDKDDEYAADELAVRLLLSAGYNPQGYLQVLARLPESGNSFSHHPRKQDRVKRLEKLLAALEKPSQGFSELPADMQGGVAPPLPPEFTSVKGAVARDKP